MAALFVHKMSLSYLTFFLYLYVLLFSFPIPRCVASDCLTDDSKISDDSSSTIISPGEVFELGFFTPDGSLNQNRYLGIWYYHSNPKIIVWVANREKPLLKSNDGYLVLNDGNAVLLDTSDLTYWKTDSVIASVNSTKLCLSDQGNLILSRVQEGQVLWQSFDHPTDTFLPGMILNGSLSLTSWQDRSNPKPAKELLLQQGKNYRVVIKFMISGTSYWENGVEPSAQIPSMLSELLVNEDGKTSLPNNTRLVINFGGQLQLWKKESERGWYVDWWEPKDRCSFDSICGNFGSCNSNDGLPCKCLPGFKPSLQEEWDLGCFTGGCVPQSGSPCQRINSGNDTFLRLPMMKVEGADCSASTEEECKNQCLMECNCMAYAYGAANCSGTGSFTEKSCLIWSHQPPRLQEEYSQGITLFVRTPSSDIESTSRDCKPCGAYGIPYPLSTDGANCGDSSYFNFLCNSKSGQVNFSTPAGTFRVTLIDPAAKSFTIQVMNANSCDRAHIDSLLLLSKNTLPFFIRSCIIVMDQPMIQLQQPFMEVVIGWQPPPEPTCSESSDCVFLPHSSCKATKGGKRRCICGSHFHWDGLQLKCTKVPFPFKIVAPCLAVALAVLILYGLFLVYHKRKRTAQKQCSVKFKGDDTECADVPFFGWESILAATKNFADANKLGVGGFGSVYRGKLPDGKEIAVKRLSSVSMQGVEEFRTEVILIARLQHRNLVRLLGYCVKADESILVYEYMPNGSLDSCLFEQTFSSYLDWDKRFGIIFGIARGLVYLHQDSRLRIIHRDLKPSNILLDEELNPKISDFGLARIVGGKETEANTNKVVGTYGYMAPEYACEGFFSIKSDVFSFGVVVLETISGRRNSRTTVFEDGLSLLGHAWRLWNEGRGLEFIDSSLKESCNHTEFLKCFHLGLLCVQEDHVDRPTMSTVVLMLSSEDTTSVSNSLPKKPAFFSRTSSETASSSSLGGSSFFTNMITVSTVGR